MRFSISITRWSAAALGPALIACGGDGPTEASQAPLPAAAVAIVSGDGQEGKAGEPLPDPFVVRVTDARGDPVAGVAVTWRLASGAGAFQGGPGELPASTVRANTDPDGVSRARFRPSALGTSTVSAEIVGVEGSPVTFSTHASAVVIRVAYDFFGPYAYLSFSGPEGSNDVTVLAGTAVEWTWEGIPGRPDAIRVVSTSVPAGGTSFDSGPLRPYERFRFVPGVAGTWEYEEALQDPPVPVTGTLTVR